MDFTQYIAQNALILVPVLYIIGMIIKNTEEIKDKYIPIILLVLGILGAVGIMGVSVDSIIQGILVTGAAVYTNQLIKQSSQKEWYIKRITICYLFRYIEVKSRKHVIIYKLK